MNTAQVITPDFRSRTLGGRPVQRLGDDAPPRPIAHLADAPCVTRPVAPVDLPPGPDARRASPRQVDAFGIPASDPDMIADLLIALETAPWREPVIRTVTSVDGAVRVHVAVGSRTFLLDPADARLTATGLDHDQPGAFGLADQLRRAAMQADWARPYHRRDARGVRPLRMRLRRRGGGVTRWAAVAMFVGLAVLSIAGWLGA